MYGGDDGADVDDLGDEISHVDAVWFYTYGQLIQLWYMYK
jgi:hypothetical protein